MQILLKYVNELENSKTVNIDNLIEKLTLGTFKVEEILEVEMNNKKAISLGISVTESPSKRLSIQEIIIEIAALLNQGPKVSKFYHQIY